MELSKEEQKKEENHPLSIYNICGKIDLGILILDSKKKEIIFSNHYYKKLAGDSQRLILDNIFKCLQSKNIRMHREVDIPGVLIGYSVYRAAPEEYLILMSDISNRKIFLETREENLYYSKLANFMAEISHEIGNPLTSVITTLQVLLKNIPAWNSEQKGDYINQSIDELKRLSKFLSKVRHLSEEDKIEKKKIFLEPVLERLYLQNRALLAAGSVSFTYDIDKKIAVVADEDALYRVFFNLLQNSLDSLPGTGTEAMISVHIEKADDFFVKLVYENNGPPISYDKLEKIFLPFVTTREAGRGMGLNISRKLMTRMGGAIKAEMPAGEGSLGVRFVLYIPIQEEGS